MKRKLYLIPILLVVGIFFSAASAYAEDVVRVYVDKQELRFDVSPLLVQDRTMVPVRGVFEALGATVVWSGDTKTVTAVKDDRAITLVIGDSAIYINGNKKELDTASFLQNDRTFVPLRAIGEAFDCLVEWNGEERQVMITTKKEQAKAMKAVNHRGYSAEAPENTLSAYRLSKQKGFKYVEADVQITTDGVPVLLHDVTIDRTSNGKGVLSEMTYREVSQYDFGSWKSEKYAGEKIPTFEEFIALCRELELHPYIEVANYEVLTIDEVRQLFSIVGSYGMQEDVTWISFQAEPLQQIRRLDKTARLGLVCESATDAYLDAAVALKTGRNEVFLNVHHSTLTPDVVLSCKAVGVLLETWTVNSETIIRNLDPYVSGVTSDYLNINTMLAGS